MFDLMEVHMKLLLHNHCIIFHISDLVITIKQSFCVALLEFKIIFIFPTSFGTF